MQKFFYSVGCRSIQQTQKIVITAEFRYQFQIFQHRFSSVERKSAQNHSEYMTFPETFTDVARVKQDFHGSVGILGQSSGKMIPDPVLLPVSYGSDNRKKIEAFGTCGEIINSSVFCIRCVRSLFQ